MSEMDTLRRDLSEKIESLEVLVERQVRALAAGLGETPPSLHRRLQAVEGKQKRQDETIRRLAFRIEVTGSTVAKQIVAETVARLATQIGQQEVQIRNLAAVVDRLRDDAGPPAPEEAPRTLKVHGAGGRITWEVSYDGETWQEIPEDQWRAATRWQGIKGRFTRGQRVKMTSDDTGDIVITGQTCPVPPPNPTAGFAANVSEATERYAATVGADKQRLESALARAEERNRGLAAALEATSRIRAALATKLEAVESELSGLSGERAEFEQLRQRAAQADRDRVAAERRADVAEAKLKAASEAWMALVA